MEKKKKKEIQKHKWKGTEAGEGKPREFGISESVYTWTCILQLPWNKLVILLRDLLEELRAEGAIMLDWVKNLPPL